MNTGAHIRLLFCTVLFAGTHTTTAFAQDAAGDQPPDAPFGVWIDHTGRGAVEITDCDGKLCGHVVWVRDSQNAEGCGLQILGNVKKTGKTTWDNGWIYSPERKKKFDVEVKPVNPDKLKLRGYAGVKLFGKTMIWKRAPSDLVLCSKQDETEQSARDNKPAQKQPKRKAAPKKVETTPEKKRKTAKQPADQDLPKIINPNAAVEEGTPPEEPREKRAARRDRDEPRLRNEPRRRNNDDDFVEEERNDYDRAETASDECRLSLPYVELTFPCDKDN